MLFKSLRLRLISSVVIIEIVMLSLLVWSNQTVIQQAHTDRLRDTASSMLQQIARTAGSYMVEVDYASLQEYLGNIIRNAELAYLVVLDQDARPVVQMGRYPEVLPHSDLHPAIVSDNSFDVSHDIDIGGYNMGRVLLGFSLDRMQQAISEARMRSIAIAAAGIFLTILTTVFIGLHLTRRLGLLARAAQKVGAGDYKVSVPAPVMDEVGTTAAAFNRMVKEVSQRTRHLEQSLARERVIEETSIDGMITYDGSCRILSVNPAMEALFCYRAQELLGKTASCLLAPESASMAAGEDISDPDFWTRTTAPHLEVTGRRKDGSCFSLELFIGHVDINNEPLFAATMHDITERKKAEHECKNLLEGNRFLIHKSLAVQEDERRYLARELHDELGQCMTAIQADAGMIHDLTAGKDTKVATSARAIVEVSARMYDVVHSMMQRLRPGVLDDLGLVAAIEEELNTWKTRFPQLECRFVKKGDLVSLGERVNITLYRVVQESLTNISKYAQASIVELLLENRGQELRFDISDNGKGMSVEKPGRGLGLIGMRERVEALGGIFELHSEPGRGLEISLRIPLADRVSG